MKRIIATISTMAIAMIFCLSPMVTKAEAEVENVDAEVVEAAAEITEGDALNIAIEKAGYSQTAVKYTKVWEDTIDGTAVYKAEFYLGPVAFCYHIDKANGEILESHVKN
ncbi:hypothetical protein [Butyrivibrio sp. AE3004]|uniref:hypothetical protein n=1 Tax=Butyrivibrio sp. AE3004 TaxID=1506994 RepID=UPI00068C046C|nr:hypothetical protein [Butyrivibrio sp. AE3004]